LLLGLAVCWRKHNGPVKAEVAPLEKGVDAADVHML